MNDKQEQKMHKKLLLFTAVAYPAFGVINTYALDPAIENNTIFISRIMFSILLILFILASEKVAIVKKEFQSILISMVYLGLTHLICIGYFNSFDTNHTAGILLAILGTSLIFKSKKQLSIYLIYVALLSTLFVAISPSSETSKTIATAIILSISAISYIFISFKLSAENNLKKANEKLQNFTKTSIEQNKKLSLFVAFIENAQEAFQATDEEGNFIFMNKTGRERLGLTKEQVENLNVLDLESVFETKEDWYAHVQETKDKNGLKIKSTNINRATGKEFPVEVIIKNAEIEGGNYQIAMSKDISEHEEQIKKNRENENQLQSVFSSMEEGIVLHDETGGIIKCNKSAEEILGLTLNQMKGKTPIDPIWKTIHIDGTDFPGNEHPASVTLNSGEICKNVIMGVHKSQDEITWISINSTPLYKEGEDKPYSVVATFKDITIEKSLEKNMRKKISQLIEAQKIAKVGNYEKDFIGDNSSWSDFMYELLQQPKNVNVRDFNFLELVEPSKFEYVRDQYHNRFLKGEPFNEILDVVLPDKTIKSLDVRVVPLFDQNNNLINIKGTLQDITAIKKLNEQNELLSRLINQLPDSIDVTNAEGNFIYANKVALNELGVTIEDLRTKNVSDIIPAYKTNPEFYKEHLEKIRKNKQVLVEREAVNSKGEKIDLEIMATYSKINNDEFLTTFARNISEKKAQERKMAQAIKDKEVAENSAKMKEEFLANMSHEIRTPMNGVIGMIDLLEKTTSPTMVQVEYLKTIKNSSKTLLDIINNILDLSKLEAGKMNLITKETQIMDVIEDIAQLYQATALEKKINLIGSFGKNIPPWILTDSTRLKQVLSNLVSNALKFTKEGSVKIRTEVAERNGSNAVLKISVEDTGEGMTEEDSKLLFSAFKQLDSSSSKMHEGTGLGLAISKNIVELFGGEIGLKSKVGKGTTFWFTIKTKVLEKDNVEHVEANFTTPKTEFLAGTKILLVDDKTVNLIVARTMLISFGCSTITAKDGFEAVEKFESNKFDVVLMDIQMPNLDGVQALHLINEKHTKRCPIIALTANAMEGDREKYIAEGFDDYLPKPIELDSLKTMLLKWKKDQ